MRATSDDAVKNVASTVLSFIEEHFGDTFNSIKPLSQHGEITYPLLWSLFPPKVLCYTEENTLQQPQIFLLTKQNYTKSDNKELSDVVRGKIISHYGDVFDFAEIPLQIPFFEGAKKSRTLDVFPLTHHA